MSTALRILLLFGAGCLFLLVYTGVKKSRFRAQETFFWILTSMVFILLCVFPDIAEWMASALGVSSPVNLVYLVVIFLLLIKIFRMERKLADTEHRLTHLIKRLAIDRLNQNEDCQKDIAE